MLLTEQEAKEKWCPFARVESSPLYRAVEDPSTGERTIIPPASGICSVNRGGSGSRDEVCCIASECMAWRVSEERRHGTRVFVTHPDGSKEETHRGYCGLAGQVMP